MFFDGEYRDRSVNYENGSEEHNAACSLPRERQDHLLASQKQEKGSANMIDKIGKQEKVSDDIIYKIAKYEKDSANMIDKIAKQERGSANMIDKMGKQEKVNNDIVDISWEGGGPVKGLLGFFWMNYSFVVKLIPKRTNSPLRQMQKNSLCQKSRQMKK